MKSLERIVERFNTVILKENEDGRLVPDRIFDFELPKDIEANINKLASLIKAEEVSDGLDEDKLMESLCQKLEQELATLKDGEKLSRRTLEEYTKAIVSNKRLRTGSESGCELPRLVREARELIRQYKLTMKIAQIIADRQGEFIKSNSLEKHKSLIIKWVASQIEGVSESTIERYIKPMRFKIGDRPPIFVKNYFVEGNKAEMVAAVIDYLKTESKAGAPKIKQHLTGLGFDVSERSVGMIKAAVLKPSFKTAMREANYA